METTYNFLLDLALILLTTKILGLVTRPSLSTMICTTTSLQYATGGRGIAGRSPDGTGLS